MKKTFSIISLVVQSFLVLRNIASYFLTDYQINNPIIPKKLIEDVHRTVAIPYLKIGLILLLLFTASIYFYSKRKHLATISLGVTALLLVYTFTLSAVRGLIFDF